LSGAAKSYKVLAPWTVRKIFSESLQRSIQKNTGINDPTAMDQITIKLVEMAMDDDHPHQFAAISMIADRLEGKPTVMVAGDKDHDPIQLEESARDRLIDKLNRIVVTEGEGEIPSTTH
jgi:hypothetical protein